MQQVLKKQNVLNLKMHTRLRIIIKKNHKLLITETYLGVFGGGGALIQLLSNMERLIHFWLIGFTSTN